MRDYFICKKDELRPYFDYILESEPGSVLDVGMLLKRSGAIGRMVCGSQLPEDLVLDGLDIPGSSFLPVYDTVYDHIYYDDEWKNTGKYDIVLAFFLCDEILNKGEGRFWKPGFMKERKQSQKKILLKK